jgi:glycosyltransferase involved in cell wall biosynthesis
MARILFVTKGNLSGPSFSLLYLLPKIQSKYDVEFLITTEGSFTRVLLEKGYIVRQLSVRYRTIPTLYRFFKEKKFDLIYLNGFSAAQWRVLIAAKIANIKVIWHIREMMTIDKNNPRHIRNRIRHADHIIAVSEACAESVKALKVKCGVTVIHNGVNLDDFNYDATEARDYLLEQVGLPKNSFIIVTIGRIHWMKNQCDAIKAINILLKRHPQVELCLFGDTKDDYLIQITSLIEQLGLQNKIHILGFRQDILHILCGADLCVHPTLAEAHPRALLESLAAGIPVVSYDVGGVKEALVDGETGYLVSRGDVDGLAERIDQLIKDPDLIFKLSAQSRQIALNCYSINQTARNVLQVIDHFLCSKIVD